MSQARRAARPRSRAAAEGAAAAPVRAPEPALAGVAPAPAWAGAHTPAPFALAGVQRSARIGPADDAYEREAEAVGRRVAAGGTVQPERISRLPAGEPSVAPERLVTAAEGKKKDKRDGPGLGAEPVQKAPASPEKKPEEKPRPPPVRKAPASPEKKPEEKPKPPPVRKAPASPEKKPEEKPKPPPVRKAPASPEKKPEEKPRPPPVQRSGAGEATPAMEHAAQRAISGKGAGEPLQPSTRGVLESRMGLDLGGVRVHDDGAARDAARALDARAFTHGRDIWLGPGESQGDVGLMAHEATHVVQQGGVQRMLVQRQGGAPSPGAAAVGGGEPLEIVIPKLRIPTFKSHTLPTADVPLGAPTPRGNTRAAWRTDVRPAVASKVSGLLQGKPGIRRGSGGAAEDDTRETADKTYIFKIGTTDNYVIGDQEELIEELTIPRWDPDGEPRPLDVDHRKELQLGGADTPDNYWLLDASANRSSGPTISSELTRTINAAVQPYVGTGPGKRWAATPSREELHATPGVTLKAQQIQANLPVSGKPSAVWEIAKVKAPDAADAPFSKLHPVGGAEAANRGLIGGPTNLVVFPASGGKKKDVSGWDAAAGEKKEKPGWLLGLTHPCITYREGQAGEIKGVISYDAKGKKLINEKPFAAALTEVGGVPFTTRIDRASLSQAMRFMELKALSPIEFTEVGADSEKGLMARGVVRPSLPIFRPGLELDIILEGNDLQLSKTFGKDDFSFPGPIRVTSAALTLGIGTQTGLFASGSASFEIERVGRGQIGARESTSGGLEIHGTFDFDSTLFDPARITLAYSDGRLHGSGEIGIPSGRVRGVRSASLRVTIDGETIDATGSVRPAIPGIERGDMALHYSPEAGLTLSGTLTLANNIPGIRSGSIHAELSKPAGADRFKVLATGTAVPRISGIDSTLTVTYDDGAFDITGTAGYNRGMLSGTVTVGATNRPLGPDGRPAGPPPEGTGGALAAYGGGSATLRLAPWLQATAGIRLLANGEIEVSGEIGLPSALELFPEKRFDRNLLTIGIDIPILGVSLAGQRIGIFANISGGLDLGAGIGPGQLRDLHLGIDYKPAHEDQTHVTGSAALHIPAQAGLRLFVRGGLGLGLLLVSGQAGIELGGTLGIEGALDAAVQVDWTPAKGLEVKAQAEIFAEPKFSFDVTGFVLVTADLFVTTIELYNKRWELASFEYGSGLRLGMRLPIHYVEGQTFDVSMDDVQFEYPQIEPMPLLEGLIARIA